MDSNVSMLGGVVRQTSTVKTQAGLNEEALTIDS